MNYISFIFDKICIGHITTTHTHTHMHTQFTHTHAHTNAHTHNCSHKSSPSSLTDHITYTQHNNSS